MCFVVVFTRRYIFPNVFACTAYHQRRHLSPKNNARKKPNDKALGFCLVGPAGLEPATNRL